MAGYGLTEKRLQPARLRNLYGGLQLRETKAAYGGLRRRLRGLFPIHTSEANTCIVKFHFYCLGNEENYLSLFDCPLSRI